MNTGLVVFFTPREPSLNPSGLKVDIVHRTIMGAHQSRLNCFRKTLSVSLDIAGKTSSSCEHTGSAAHEARCVVNQHWSEVT